MKKEQAEEFRQVATLLVQDIKVLSVAADNWKDNADMLYGLIHNLQEKCDRLVQNKEVRETRFNAFSGLNQMLYFATQNQHDIHE